MITFVFFSDSICEIGSFQKKTAGFYANKFSNKPINNYETCRINKCIDDMALWNLFLN